MALTTVSEAKVALLHDYLVDNGGAERVVEVFQEIFPAAPLYTSLYAPPTTLDSFAGKSIRTSFLQRFKLNKRNYKWVLPVYPFAFGSFNLAEFDILLSSTTSFAKGVRKKDDTCHFCFMHTPTRFIWLYDKYVEQENFKGVKKLALDTSLPFLRRWDYKAAQKVDYFIANSHNCRQRIEKFYRREATVIHSPIDASRFEPAAEIDDYFLVVSRLVPYKRLDLAVSAAAMTGKPLKVVGTGVDLDRLKRLAGPDTKFLGRVDDRELKQLYRRCQALIFPGEEDFGLTPLEAMASGRPVIAYRAGGALETVIDGETGLFFDEQTVTSLAAVMQNFIPENFRTQRLREWAGSFDKEQFKQKLGAFMENKYAEFQARPAAKAVPV
jgi:glycosyltransferase involved in cell wall biosynthesis